MIDKDQFGFYTVGSFKTYSKLEAVEASARLKQPVEWNFNRNVFSKYPWHIEPPHSLDYYYAQRAKQIREKYDYIVLWYSGGADSHNVLMSFVNNNIFIDEIAQYHSLKGAQGDKTTNMNQEVFETSFPKTQELIANNPVYKHTYHNLIDLSDIMSQVFLISENKWDNFYNSNMYVAPGALSRTYLREKIPHYKNLIDQGRKVCFLWALEKPQVCLEGDSFYFDFKDGLDGCIGVRTQRLGREWEHDELFYWSPDAPDLICKQGHVIKKFLQLLTPSHIDNYHVLDKKPNFDTYGVNLNLHELCITIVKNNQTYSLSNYGLHRLIYSNFDPTSVVAKKPQSLIYNIRDEWWYKPNSGDFGQYHFNRAVAWYRNLVKKCDPDIWWEYKFDRKKSPYSGGFLSSHNKYFLGKLTSTQ
jgi:hypothetical protein